METATANGTLLPVVGKRPPSSPLMVILADNTWCQCIFADAAEIDPEAPETIGAKSGLWPADSRSRRAVVRRSRGVADAFCTVPAGAAFIALCNVTKNSGNNLSTVPHKIVPGESGSLSEGTHTRVEWVLPGFTPFSFGRCRVLIS